MINASYVLLSFTAWARKTPSFELYGGGRCLADYVYTWVRSGEGWSTCNFDFAQIQSVTLIIADHWLRNPAVTDLCEFRNGSHVTVQRRPVATVFDEVHGYEHPLLDPEGIKQLFQVL